MIILLLLVAQNLPCSNRKTNLSVCSDQATLIYRRCHGLMAKGTTRSSASTGMEQMEKATEWREATNIRLKKVIG